MYWLEMFKWKMLCDINTWLKYQLYNYFKLYSAECMHNATNSTTFGSIILLLHSPYYWDFLPKTNLTHINSKPMHEFFLIGSLSNIQTFFRTSCGSFSRNYIVIFLLVTQFCFKNGGQTRKMYFRCKTGWSILAFGNRFHS